MRSLLRDAIDILRSDGIKKLLLRSLNFVYRRTLVPFLPRRSVQYNGVDVPAVRLFDRTLPWRSWRDRPNYESGLISGIEGHTNSGDDVVIVGGGWGVTAVKAAEKVGSDGTVTVYEGSAKEVERVRRTVSVNGYSKIVTVNHAIVGTALNLRGDSKNAKIVDPSNLPQCDILELDCEGSEIEILEGLTIHPDVILVETHGRYNAPTDEVVSILSRKSYSVVRNVIADEDLREQCESDDIRVLTALNDD
ncbi:FkbM family methyltransferase [Halorubrum ezzemoulense]|uniref:FkbM family methyltransferase n=1 Tax=Halorubrum ezzemoulense TaxID=337243 RepID=UPI002330BBCB|nr:FkbM family methyltransferase [Halorubrum ezzemoulense]MDB2248604.1 FkbM family methyltransferase [Halorubrum ezzemoulense]